MQILLNGESKELSQETTLSMLVDQMDLMGKRYAVEVNLEIIPKVKHEEFLLSDGDRVEIVHAVGGG